MDGQSPPEFWPPALSAEAIDKLCDEFESAFRQGHRRTIESFTADASDADLDEIVPRLVALEMLLLMEHRQPIDFSGDLRRFPSYAEGLRLLQVEDGAIFEFDDDHDGVLPVTMLQGIAEQGRRFEHFELKHVLGRGGFGTVWLATDTVLQREVAIKIPRDDKLSEGQRRMFWREARAAAKLRHPHLVSIHELRERRGDLPAYIVTEYVDGPSLKRWLEQNQCAPAKAAQLVAKLALALHHAHEEGVVHRDVKSANILLDANEEPHLTDFGLAKRDAEHDSLAIENQLVGTPHYMAPEQIRADHEKIDRRTDIYALGVVLYELLTGRLPFQGSLETLVAQISGLQPALPRTVRPGLPTDLEKICLKCLAKEPAARYQTGQALADDLHRYLNGETLLGIAAPVRQRVQKWAWRQRKLLTALSVTVLGCALIGWAAYESARPVEFWRTVEWVTEPPGCQITVVQLDENGSPDPDKIIRAKGQTPLTTRLQPGDYLVVAVLKERFHEVIRSVPRADESITMLTPDRNWQLNEKGLITYRQPIVLPRPDISMQMGFVEGSDAWTSPLVPGDSKSRQQLIIPGFFVDQREITATAESTEPGALTSSSYLAAAKYAEQQGKRLPSVEELFYLQSLVSGEELEQSGGDAVLQLQDGKTLTGLFRSPWEWTSRYQAQAALQTTAGSFTPMLRLAGAGALPVSLQGNAPLIRSQWFPEHRINLDCGVRCVRSARPRVSREDFVRPSAAR